MVTKAVCTCVAVVSSYKILCTNENSSTWPWLWYIKPCPVYPLDLLTSRAFTIYSLTLLQPAWYSLAHLFIILLCKAKQIVVWWSSDLEEEEEDIFILLAVRDWWRTGNACSKEPSQVSVDTSSQCHIWDVVAALWSHRDHCAHIHTNCSNATEAAAGVRCNHHWPVL